MGLTDIEIAQAAKIKPIVEVAAKLGLKEDDLELYGKFKGKIAASTLHKLESQKSGKVILVTSINQRQPVKGNRR